MTRRCHRVAASLFLVLLVICVSALPGWTQSGARPSGLHFIDVSQGSALLVVDADVSVMIDSGSAGAAEAVLAAITAHGLTSIDLWVHTHFDADHVGGFTRALAGVDGVAGSEDDLRVWELWDRGLSELPDTEVVAAYVSASGGLRRAVAAGERWQRGGITVTVVAGPDEAPVENSRGLALRVQVGKISVMVQGDLPAAALSAVAVDPVDVLWAAHHGALDGTSPDLLMALDPEQVVVSAGFGNAYCHPHPLVLSWLHDRRVWLMGAAGVAPTELCDGIVDHLAAEHVLVGGDLWISADEDAGAISDLPGGSWDSARW